MLLNVTLQQGNSTWHRAPIGRDTYGSRSSLAQLDWFPPLAIREDAFHQINAQTGRRLRQQMVDEATARVVDRKHKGRGYELSKGRYVEIDEDELAAVEIESTHIADIDSFVPLAEIDKRLEVCQ